MSTETTQTTTTTPASAEAVAATTGRTMMTMPKTAFDKRLSRATLAGEERGRASVLENLPALLKEKHGLDLDELKAITAKAKAEKPTSTTVKEETPQQPGETRVDYDARIKELLAAERAEHDKKLADLQAAYDKRFKEVSDKQAEREAMEAKALEEAEAEEAWGKWRGFMTEQGGVEPKRLRLVENEAHRFLDELHRKDENHILFKDDATEAQQAEAWRKEFLEPLAKDYPELFVQSKDAQGNPTRTPGTGPASKVPPVDVMKMTPAELRAYKEKLGITS